MERYDVLISGMGPAGLSVAWEAIRAGKTVCLLTNRAENDYSRIQKVFLHAETREYLHLMFNSFPRKDISEEDKEFLLNLDTKRAIPISDVERYILRRIKEQDNSKYKIFENSMLSDVDLFSGQAQIIDSKNKENGNSEESGKNEEIEAKVPVFFDFLISADGTRHHAVDEVNKNLPPKQHITYKGDFKLPHKYHISTFIPTIKMVDNSPIILPVKKENESEDARIHVDKDGLYLATIFAYTSNDQTKIECNVNCEIPRGLYYLYYKSKGNYFDLANQSDPDREQLQILEKAYLDAEQTIEKFIKNKILSELKLSPEDVEFNPDKNNEIEFLPFVTILNQASKTSIQENNKIFILVGDSYRSSYYPWGHGINDALLQGKFLQKIFNAKPDKLQGALNEYEKKCKELALEAKIGAAIGSFSLFKKTLWSYTEKKAQEHFSKFQEDRELPDAHKAVLKKNAIGIIKGILERNKLELFIQNSKGQNILHFALEKNKLDVFNWINKNDYPTFQKLIAQQDKNGKTPIHLFALQENPDDAIQAFMAFAPSKKMIGDYRDEHQNTYAHIAMENKTPHLKLLNFIYVKDPNLFLEKNDSGDTAIENFYRVYAESVTAPDNFSPTQKENYREILKWLEEKNLGSEEEALKFCEPKEESDVSYLSPPL